MARGFESKSVEFQQEEAARGRRKFGPAPSAQQQAADERRRTLTLALRRTRDDLSRASAAPHRRMLEQALATLEAHLRELEAPHQRSDR